MDTKSAISIIVPVYNTEKYLRRCLDSIVVQTYRDWECIIVDDGSTDGSAAICDEYDKKDSRFKVLHKENEGVSAARNVGIDHAEGDFITFVDSDDYLSSEYLQDLYNHKEYDYVVGSFQTFPEHSTVIAGNEAYRRTNFTNFLRLCNLCNGYPWGKLFKASIIKEYNIRFNQNLAVYEDHIFCLDYIKHIESAIQIPDANYFYYNPASKIVPLKFPLKKETVLYLYEEVRKYLVFLSKKWRVDLPAITFDFIIHNYKDILDRGNDDEQYAIYKNIYPFPSKDKFYKTGSISPIYFTFHQLINECSYTNYSNFKSHLKAFQTLYAHWLRDIELGKTDKLFVIFLRLRLYWMWPLLKMLLHIYYKIRIRQSKANNVVYMSDITGKESLGTYGGGNPVILVARLVSLQTRRVA